jgi:peptidyl-dipeptidase Dcp
MDFNWQATIDELKKIENDKIDELKKVYDNVLINSNILDNLKNENIIYSNIYNYFAFIHDITDNFEIKKTCKNILQILIKTKKNIYSNKSIFDNLRKLCDIIDNLELQDKKLLAYILIEFKNNGIDKNEQIKKEIADLNDKIFKYKNYYDNILETEPIFVLKKSESLGLSSYFLEMHKNNNNKKNEHENNQEYSITLNEHTYNYMLHNIESSSIREKLQSTYYGYYRGVLNNDITKIYTNDKNINLIINKFYKEIDIPYKDNSINLKNIIIYRSKLAEKMGFKTYIDYVNRYQTLKTSKKIKKFLFKLNNSLNKQYNEDIKTLCNHFNIQQINNKYNINSWDLSYYMRKYNDEKIQYSQNITDFFPKEQTLKNIIELFNYEFKSINIKEVENIQTKDVWHKDVKIYNVYNSEKKNNSEKKIGVIYFDLFTRPSKVTDSSTITIREPIENNGIVQIAIVCIMTNFPIEERNNCFHLNEVSILLHEILHGLHIILGKCKYSFVCSNNIESSFVETFPQLMELWLNDINTIKKLTYHRINGKQMDDKLAQNIIHNNNKFKSINTKFQIMLSLLDNILYDENVIFLLKTSTKRPLDFIYKIINDLIYNTENITINIYPENNPLLIFNHLTSNYGGQYYGYIFGENIAKNIFDLIKNNKANVNNLMKSIMTGNNYNPSDLLKKYFHIQIEN